MKKSPLLLLILVVFISGCTTGGGTIFGGGGVGGVIIKDFSTMDTTVEPATPVTLNLVVQNTGTIEARGVTAQLYYLPSGVSVQQGKIQSFGDLIGANPTREIQGEEASFQWTLTAPEKETDMPYSPKVRLSYGYSTVVNVRLKAVTIDWYKQKKEKGGIELQKQTGGPLTITASSTNSIISGGKTALTFSIQNNGGGRVYSGGSPTGDNADSLSYSVSGAGVNCRPNPVRLMNDGTSNKVVCTISVSSSEPVVPLDIKFETNYNYYIDRGTTFTVLQKIA